MTGSARFERAIAAIDEANAGDPNVITVAGVARPKELAHAEMVSTWVRRLDPGASEALLLAARAHHLRRWEIPRASYPTGRAGYLRWRRALHEHHAGLVAKLLEAGGYESGTVARVQDLVRKRGLGRDPEVQVLEDALCLVFLETQFSELAARVEPDTLDGVVRKTFAKMSENAREAALSLPLADEDRTRLERGLTPPGA